MKRELVLPVCLSVVLFILFGAVVVRAEPPALAFGPGQSLPATTSRDVALKDLDGDGDLDLYLANDFWQADQVWINQGGSQAGTAGAFVAGDSLGDSEGQAVALGDLDGDGHPDAFVGNYLQPNTSWINNGDGTFGDGGFALGDYNSMDVALGDFDHDGDLDAFVANDGGFQPDVVWINMGASGWVAGAELGDYPSQAVALGYLDADGNVDAFVAVLGVGNRVWLGNGSGGFSDSGQSLGSGWSYDVALGDMDGDGALDAVVANNLANELWLNDGDGTFPALPVTFGEGESRGVALGDLDGDGDLDVVIANDAGQPNEVWLNDGDGGLTLSPVVIGSSLSQAVALGDVDGSGTLDVIIANHDVPSEIWLNLTPTNVSLRQTTVGAGANGLPAIVWLLAGLALFSSWRWALRR